MRLLLIIWLGVFSWFANAQTEPAKKTKEELQVIFLAAEASFEARDYQPALEGYLLLYQETEQIDMLFNAAQCQRFLNRYTTAIDSYQAYLRAQPASPKRNAIDEVVVEMTEKLKRQAEQQKKARRRNLGLSGGFLLASVASGTTALIITREAKEQGDFPRSKRAQATALSAIADVSLVTSGVWLFVALRPKKPTYTLEFSLTPSEVQVAVHF